MNTGLQFARIAALVLSIIGCVIFVIAAVAAYATFAFGIPEKGKFVPAPKVIRVLARVAAIGAVLATCGFWWMKTTK